MSRYVTAVTLIALVPALLPFSRAAELPIVIGAAIGIYALLRDRARLLGDVSARAMGMALGLYVLAACISAIDAVDAEKSWSTSLASLRLLFFALGIRWLLIDHAPDSRLAWAAALPVALWAVDGAAQAFFGVSLGGPLNADRLSGIFGADDLKLGPLLPALAPLLLWPLLTRAFQKSTPLRVTIVISAYLLLALVVLLAGARAGWVSFLLVTLLMVRQVTQHSMRLGLGFASAALIAMTLIGIGAYSVSDHFKARVDRTLAFRSGDANTALAGRLPIWRTATTMIAANPINGVGVRSFRFAYPTYAAPDDPWIDPSGTYGAAHAHQIVLELLSETGMFGLVAWLAAARLLWRQRQAALSGAAAALFVLMFPLNTHLAFYSSFMGIVVAWLVALHGVGTRRP